MMSSGHTEMLEKAELVEQRRERSDRLVQAAYELRIGDREPSRRDWVIG